MNSLTHMGMMQIARRHAPGVTGPNFSVDVIRAMSGAALFGPLAVIEMATIVGDEALALGAMRLAAPVL